VVTIIPMRTLAVTNQKGGVGKTTTVHHLAVALAKRQQRVLVVDLDPQAHASLALRAAAAAGSAYDLLRSERTVADVAVAAGAGIEVVSSEQRLARYEAEANAQSDWMFSLRSALDRVRGRYDWCLIDTPPSLGALSTNALVAADAGVLVPLVPEPLPLKGLQLLLATVGELHGVNPDLKVAGIVPTMVHARWATHSSVLDVLPHLLGDIPILEPVPLHGSFVRATAKRCSIFDIAPRSSGAQVYETLAQTLLSGSAAEAAA
jgi:chromosome partitioning protein